MATSGGGVNTQRLRLRKVDRNFMLSWITDADANAKRRLHFCVYVKSQEWVAVATSDVFTLWCFNCTAKLTKKRKPKCYVWSNFICLVTLDRLRIFPCLILETNVDLHTVSRCRTRGESEVSNVCRRGSKQARESIPALKPRADVNGSPKTEVSVKPRADITRSPKQGYQCPTKRTCVLQFFFFFKKVTNGLVTW